MNTSELRPHRVRPVSEWPVQTELLARLSDDIAADRVPHAMLFVGEEAQTRRCVNFLSALLLCTGEPAPCGRCPSCAQLQSGNHPDLYTVERDGAGIKAAQVEALQERLKLRAHAGGRVVYVVHGMDDITPVAANRLLKTLEEPWPSVVALLTARSVRRVLPTIRSRCFLFPLPPAGAAPWDDAPWVDGEAGEAVGADGAQPEPAEGRFASLIEPVIQWTKTLIKGAEPPVILADRLVRTAGDGAFSEVLYVLAMWLRDLMHTRAGDDRHVRFTDHRAQLLEQSSMTDVAELAKAIAVVLETRVRTRSHVAATLNAERMCVRLREVFASVHGHRRPL
ncbi:hypothetical protein [Alicyclobacillus sp.]|uniref:hypothetical protein n=1 Tax=Alicyclobacillus sp. TaxID=61169 RepID=UPI0025BD8D71|nr:hypothetical protein [Alicyclobacillus sp.]MCL6516612.1 hypothetical protein [Alicyclobacillus sp.]